MSPTQCLAAGTIAQMTGTNKAALTGSMAFSSYGQSAATPSAVARMMASAAADFRPGVDVNLGVGYVNEATLPNDVLNAAAQAILGDPQTYPGVTNYGSPSGQPRLIDALGRFLGHRKIGHLSPEAFARHRTIIAPAGATSLLDALSAIFEPGIVLTADPVYYIYTDLLARAGFEVVAIPESRNGLTGEAVSEAIAQLGPRSKDIRFAYVSTVSNPSCTVMSGKNKAGVLDAMARLSQDSGIARPVFFDAAYELLIHDGAASGSGSPLNSDTTGLAYEIGSLSKNIAPTLRVGFITGPDGPLMDAIVQRSSDVGLCPSPLLQEMAAYAIDNDGPAQLKRVNRAYRYKAKNVRNWIKKLFVEPQLLDGMTGGEAGFYYYLTFRHVTTGEDSSFFRYLSRTTGDPAIDGKPGRPKPRVIYLPGQYCVHPEGQLQDVAQRQLRISYGYEDLPNLQKALDLMLEAADYAYDVAEGEA